MRSQIKPNSAHLNLFFISTLSCLSASALCVPAEFPAWDANFVLDWIAATVWDAGFVLRLLLASA